MQRGNLLGGVVELGTDRSGEGGIGVVHRHEVEGFVAEPGEVAALAELLADVALDLQQQAGFGGIEVAFAEQLGDVHRFRGAGAKVVECAHAAGHLRRDAVGLAHDDRRQRGHGLAFAEQALGEAGALVAIDDVAGAVETFMDQQR